jgi:Protein of unknown function (DUF4232)
MQQQYATIRVRNGGGSGCWLLGYARVGLLVGGRATGRPAAPANAGRPALFLRANASATASLHGPSTCNAPLSDHARITAPGQSGYTDAAMVMRVCALHIDAFHAA